MNFTSLELSKKLVALGCVSESGFFHKKRYLVSPDQASWLIDRGYPQEAHNVMSKVEAFCLEDFVGTHEQAKENARLLFEDPWSTKRYEMIDSEDWRAYLEKAVEGR